MTALGKLAFDLQAMSLARSYGFDYLDIDRFGVKWVSCRTVRALLVLTWEAGVRDYHELSLPTRAYGQVRKDHAFLGDEPYLVAPRVHIRRYSYCMLLRSLSFLSSSAAVRGKATHNFVSNGVKRKLAFYPECLGQLPSLLQRSHSRAPQHASQQGSSPTSQHSWRRETPAQPCAGLDAAFDSRVCCLYMI